MDDERRRDKEWGDLLEKFATITASSRVEVADHAGKAESRSRDADKFANLEISKRKKTKRCTSMRLKHTWTATLWTKNHGLNISPQC